MWSVELYETESGRTPVKDFLLGLSQKHRAKALNDIDLLETFGTALQMPHVRPIDGKLWELRIKFASDISRVLYFIPVGNKIVLLHGFAKKTQRTPPAEIKRAKRYMEDWERRRRHDL